MPLQTTGVAKVLPPQLTGNVLLLMDSAAHSHPICSLIQQLQPMSHLIVKTAFARNQTHFERLVVPKVSY